RPPAGGERFPVSPEPIPAHRPYSLAAARFQVAAPQYWRIRSLRGGAGSPRLQRSPPSPPPREPRAALVNYQDGRPVRFSPKVGLGCNRPATKIASPVSAARVRFLRL